MLSVKDLKPYEIRWISRGYNIIRVIERLRTRHPDDSLEDMHRFIGKVAQMAVDKIRWRRRKLSQRLEHIATAWGSIPTRPSSTTREELLITSSDSRDQLKHRLLHFGRSMRIQHLGEVVIHQLVDWGLVRDIADLYYLTVDDLVELDCFTEKSAQTLVNAVQASKGRGLARLLKALGVVWKPTDYSEQTQFLVAHFGSMEQLMKASLCFPFRGEPQHVSVRKRESDPAISRKS